MIITATLAAKDPQGGPLTVRAHKVGGFLIHRAAVRVGPSCKPPRKWTTADGWTVTHEATGCRIFSGLDGPLSYLKERLALWQAMATDRDPSFMDGISTSDVARATDSLRPHMSLFRRLLDGQVADRMNAPIPGMDAR